MFWAMIPLWYKIVQWYYSRRLVDPRNDSLWDLRLETLFSKCLQCHCFRFSCKNSWDFCIEKRHKIKSLGFFVDFIMEAPFEMAGTFPGFDGIVFMIVEEITKIQKDSCWLDLIRINQRIKDLFDYMNGISNDNNLWNIDELQRLIDATPNGK